tara:strand:- start:290 stop:1105 length:816 start_codon:yes stop_codon:yes gene_type:complete
MNIETDDLVSQVVKIAKLAGDSIMDIYEKSYDIEEKVDGSPVTTADHVAHDTIVSHLAELTPHIPIVSEESKGIDNDERLTWTKLWLVDPLDGTKEFINRNGEFTVNIGLVEHGEPVAGVVYSPVLKLCYFASLGSGAWCQLGSEKPQKINVNKFDFTKPRVVASRSHSGNEVEQFCRALAEKNGYPLENISMGSALKVCVIARGDADVYPRFGPTSEWDTCASHCVLNEAGGQLVDYQGNAFVYNKPSLINPWFLAFGDKEIEWTKIYSE